MLQKNQGMDDFNNQTDESRRDNDRNRVLTFAEAEEMLKLSETALRRLCRTSKIAYTKTGRTITFRLGALWDYQSENEVPAAPPNPHGLTDASLKRIRGY